MRKFIVLLMVSSMFFLLSAPIEAAKGTETTYIVKPGDSLWKISVRFKVGITELIDENPQFTNPNLIYPGDKVTIPLINDIKRFEQQVISLTNKERVKNGLSPLKANWQLSRVARYKSKDLRDKNYFGHTSPTYGSPFKMMKSFGISYNAAAENIAAGQKTPEQVVSAWMNSSGHRKNILDPSMTEIGVGYAKGGKKGYYWTQMFIKR